MDLQLDVLSDLYLRIRIYEAATQTDIVNSSFMAARQAFTPRREKNLLSRINPSLA
jgi:hypothetical protein